MSQPDDGRYKSRGRKERTPEQLKVLAMAREKAKLVIAEKTKIKKEMARAETPEEVSVPEPVKSFLNDFSIKKLRSTSRNFSKNLEIVRSSGVARRRFLVMFVDFFADVGVSEKYSGRHPYILTIFLDLFDQRFFLTPPTPQTSLFG